MVRKLCTILSALGCLLFVATASADNLPCVDWTDCNDGDSCTWDSCDRGTCFHDPIANCEPASPDCEVDADCDDGDACTYDSCFAGVCYNDPDPYCGGCLADVDCADSDPCTADVCDEDGICRNDYDPALCPDIPCLIDEDCLPDDDDCTDDFCDAAGVCRHDPIPGCGATPPVVECLVNADCADADACTYDTCQAYDLDGDGDVDQATCFHEALVCDDFDPCTADACDPGSGCVYTPPDCADGNACTLDTCDSTTGLCVFPAISYCYPGDGCCPVGCGRYLDADCPCQTKGKACTYNKDCCSNKCSRGVCK